MEDRLGIGKSGDVKSGCVPAGCKMSTQSEIAVTGWACDRTDCEAYGKWYCPFSW